MGPLTKTTPSLNADRQQKGSHKSMKIIVEEPDRILTFHFVLDS